MVVTKELNYNPLHHANREVKEYIQVVLGQITISQHDGDRLQGFQTTGEDGCVEQDWSVNGIRSIELKMNMSTEFK